MVKFRIYLVVLIVLFSLLVKLGIHRENVGVIFTNNGNSLNVFFHDPETNELKVRVWDLTGGKRVEVEEFDYDGQSFFTTAYTVGKTAFLSPISDEVYVFMEDSRGGTKIISVYGRVVV